MARKTHIALILSYLLTLVGCSFNPFTTDNELTGNAVAPAIGAGIGAGSMALLKAPKSMVWMAGIGGAALGYYMSSLKFAAGGVQHVGGEVYTVGDFVTINIPSDKLFDINSSELLPEAGPVLDSAVSVLSRYPNDNVIVSGNTSNFGTNQFEEKISEARARQVSGYLWAHGINNFNDKSINATRKLTYVGYGSYFPIANDIHNNSIRANSRIQITGYPCKSSLHLGRKQKPFNNIGDIDAGSSTRSSQNVVDFNREFPNEGLPEHGSSNAGDYNGMNEDAIQQARISPEPPIHPSHYQENENSQGENWANYKSDSSAVQTTSGGNVAKQGGYKGEG